MNPTWSMIYDVPSQVWHNYGFDRHVMASVMNP